MWNPLEDIMAAGSLEEERNVDNAREAFNFLKDNFGMYIPGPEYIDEALDNYDVDYIFLPRYAKDWFNYFELPED